MGSPSVLLGGGAWEACLTLKAINSSACQHSEALPKQQPQQLWIPGIAATAAPE